MLKKQTILVDKESGEEWRIDERTPGNTVNGPDGKPTKLYVYVLRNEKMHRRFVYEHMVDREFAQKTD
ncbi:MAG: hypothetical protein WAO58_00770 [Fimbriimonadaceae bacterium]